MQKLESRGLSSSIVIIVRMISWLRFLLNKLVNGCFLLEVVGQVN